jgi:hypothetical protein
LNCRKYKYILSNDSEQTLLTIQNNYQSLPLRGETDSLYASAPRDMATPAEFPNLPANIQAVFSQNEGNDEALLIAFMPVFCDHVGADRIFLQPRNPFTRVCKILQWRRNDEIPW